MKFVPDFYMDFTYIGAIPVFVDVDENTLCIDSKIEKVITKSKAIIAVDLLGIASI